MNLEVCYTFRYMEKNGRTSGNPWSLRQTGVYQQTHLETGRSTWILLQPSSGLREHLRKLLLHSATRETSFTIDPMQLHQLILYMGLNQFGDFIEDLQSEIMQLVRQSLDLDRNMHMV
jgi:hypothetical protein